MEKINFISCRGIAARFCFSLLVAFTIFGCAHRKTQVNGFDVSQFRFEFNGESYRIRSISSVDKAQSYNELIGDDFVAADFDQDRIIDHISLGNVSLAEVQKIYKHGLDQVTQERKLQVRVPKIASYWYEDCGLRFEIRSFRPANAPPFNEFKITDPRQIIPPAPVVIVDYNADGTLDEILTGAVDLEEAQSQYASAIEAGLQSNELTRSNGTILVREK
jgi:hypothetical protein